LPFYWVLARASGSHALHTSLAHILAKLGQISGSNAQGREPKKCPTQNDTAQKLFNIKSQISNVDLVCKCLAIAYAEEEGWALLILAGA